MGKTLLLMRHAETTLNANPVNVGGRSNWAPLSARGNDQIRDAAQYFISHNIVPDFWFSSPAVRALQTGRQLLQRLGISLDPRVDGRLQEMSQGTAEGQPRALIWTPEVNQQAIEGGFNFKLPGGESFNEVANRKHEFISEYFSTAPEGSVALVTGHGLAIRCAVGRILGWSRDELLDTVTPNCSLTALSYDDALRVDYFARDILINNVA